MHCWEGFSGVFCGRGGGLGERRGEMDGYYVEGLVWYMIRR